MKRTQTLLLICSLAMGALPSVSFARSGTHPHTGAHARNGAHARAGVSVQHGEASYYAHRFHGRQMADQGIFNEHSNSAASLRLPLGTVAMVTNEDNGHAALVRIRDRGPYSKYIIDLSHATASRLGFIYDGHAPVTVRVISLPNTHRVRSRRLRV